MYFPHISKSWNPNIMRCVSTLYFRQIMTALHFLCIGARWRVLPLINNWCHQVLMYWFTISILCRTKTCKCNWILFGCKHFNLKKNLFLVATIKPEGIHHKQLMQWHDLLNMRLNNVTRCHWICNVAMLQPIKVKPFYQKRSSATPHCLSLRKLHQD